MNGTGRDQDQGCDVSGGALDQLMPMHLWIDAGGRILRAGPTVTKMAGQGDLTGQALFDVIVLRRPDGIDTVAGLAGLARQRIGLVLRGAPHLPLRGALALLPAGQGMILDVALGLSFAKAVAGFDLTLNDFSPCDQTVELLYLQEANTLARELSRHLTQRLETARAMAEAEAMTDPLTGLANRRAMDAEISRILADPTAQFGLLQVDLDLFKQVNDSFGHAAGDAVLERVGQVLRHQLRLHDLAARVGGDEFTVLIRDCVTPDDLGRVAARLIQALETPVIHRGNACRISASVGIAVTTSYAMRPSLERLLADADHALYAAKHAGRGRYAFFAAPPVVPVSPRAMSPRRRADDLPPDGFRRRQNDRVPRPD